MSAQHKPLYSQGLNFGSYISDGVDARTGQFTCSIALFKAPAEARNCPPLNLTLSYNPLSLYNVGFGLGWSLNLSSYKHRLQSPMLYLSTGEHFQVDSLGTLTIKDKRLDSFTFSGGSGGTTHQIIYKSGLIERLSNFHNTYSVSVPVEIQASTGQALRLSWTQDGDGTPLLTAISHGSESLLEIKYRSNQVLVTRAPGTKSACVTTLTLHDGLLTEMQLPQEEARLQPWEFFYTEYLVKSTSLQRLTRVKDPAKLVSAVEYEPRGHLLPTGGPMEAIPRVLVHTKKPGHGQPALVTHYTYSPENFFGFGDVQSWQDGVDNLYRASSHYKYTATMSVDDGPKTTYTYNKFHLLVETKREQGLTVVNYAVDYKVDTAAVFERQRKSFQLPTRITTTYEDHGGSNARSRIETTEHEYDDWGNPISETDKTGVCTKREYYPPQGAGKAGEELFCPADPGGFCRYVKKETVYPSKHSGLVPAPTHTRQYNYLQLPMVTGHGSFVAAREMQLKDTAKNKTLLSKTYDYYQDAKLGYRDHGRLKSEATAIAGHEPTTDAFTYSYSPCNGMVTKFTNTKTWDGQFTTAQNVTYSLLSGRVLSRTNAQGVSDVFEYDGMDRLVKATAASETPHKATRQAEYQISKEKAGSIVLITDSKGMRTKQTTDALGRLCRVEAQGDIGGPLRLIEERSYNKIGQCVEIVKYDWIGDIGGQAAAQSHQSKTRMEYDDWGQVCRTVKSSAGSNLSAFLSIKDPIYLTQVEGIEGQGRTRSSSDLFGNVTCVELLRKEGTGKHQPYSTTNYKHDGLGRLVQKTDQFGHSNHYELDDYGRVAQTTGPDGSIIKTVYEGHSSSSLPIAVEVGHSATQKTKNQVMGQRSLDGLSRVVKQTVGGRVESQIYNGIAPGPSTVVAPTGESKTAVYNVALANSLTKLQSPDEVATFDYDEQSGFLLNTSNSDISAECKYLASGLPKSERIKVRGLQRELYTARTYSMAGKLAAYTNVHGKVEDRVYDGFGRLTGVKHGSVTVTLQYDASNGLASSRVVDELTKKSVGIKRERDEFGREIKRTISHGSSEKTSVSWVMSQSFNELGLMTERAIKTGGGSVLRKESFAYDERGRLVSYKCTGSRPPADEKGKPIKAQQFVFDTYDNIQQMTTISQDNSQNVRSYAFGKDDPTQLVGITNTDSRFPAKIDLVYDKNGRLTRDEEGRRLAYNSRNALVAVTDATGKFILSKYRYDASGRLICQEAGGKSTYFFYRSNELIAMIRDGLKISFLSNAGEYFAQISEGDGANSTSAVQLWATDGHLSVLGSVETALPTEDVQYQHYSPYGSGRGEAIIGYNGQYRDPVSGWYHLGHGYRVYNPVLMRFHTPEPLSPFTTGEINAYAYCLGDPINRTDPTGHMSGRNWAMLGVGLVVGILVGIATAGLIIAPTGASIAVEVGAFIASGTASDVLTGAVYDVANGKQPTLESIGEDAAMGAIGGAVAGAAGVALRAVVGLGVVQRALRPITSRWQTLQVGLRLAKTERAERVFERQAMGGQTVAKSRPGGAEFRFAAWIRSLGRGERGYYSFEDNWPPFHDNRPLLRSASQVSRDSELKMDYTYLNLYDNWLYHEPW
ncbi:RHS Repeat protein [Cordyceps militaris CM01]|uniref:RHS Repeat protein n=1 Tax=Cordyceps militaris (strain CM01) TaxID=983644 RepID=G3JUS5_CORMM|nr:RHS Repeat protein [Cordyceps militaris CM01]EGX87875.1 RHS Repeat protein [Cordyceps militaris CM01]